MEILAIKLQAFNANVSDDMNTFLKTFQKKKMRLILDLRSNPGGYLKQAQLVMDRFISSGVLVSTIEGQTENIMDIRHLLVIPYPMYRWLSWSTKFSLCI